MPQNTDDQNWLQNIFVTAYGLEQPADIAHDVLEGDDDDVAVADEELKAIRRIS